MEVKRILCIVGSMNPGGAETFLMKLYREMDKNLYQIDFLISYQKKSFYEDEIILLGGKIYRGYPKSKNPIKSYLRIKDIVKKNNYEYVMRMSENSLSTLDLWAAKKGGANKLIMRSTNTKASSSILLNIMHKLFKFLPKKIVDFKIAPSTESAKHMFGNKKTLILKNALDLKMFEFNNKKRIETRDRLNLSDKFIVGHIGRFSRQKNHEFIIKIFSELSLLEKESYLLLIGEGEEYEDVIRLAKDLNLMDKITVISNTTKVNEFLMSMDLLLFPSLYEGLPNVVIEAQATGLPCLISDTITKEVKISDLITSLSIKENPLMWAEYIIKYKSTSENVLDRKKYKNIIEQKGYDIKQQAKIFIEYVFGGVI